MGIVIVGGGRAGVSAAEGLRQGGYTGSVILVCEEPHAPYDRPPLSKEVLLNRVAGDLVPVLEDDGYDQNKIELWTGVRATRINREDKTLDLADGRSLPYEKLILATGLRSRKLSGYALGDRLHYLRSVDDARRLRERLASGTRLLVIGAGLLGLEIAATAKQLGCVVTVVEKYPSVLYRSVAPIVGDYVTQLHLRHDVRILTGTTVLDMHHCAENSRAVRAELSNGKVMECDLVVAAIGSVVNAELAEACGLEVQDGIVADAYGRTSDPDIYAVGDVARHYNALLRRTIRVESWHNALNQSNAVGHAIAGAGQAYAEVPWFWSDQFNMNFQTVGYCSDWDHVVVRGDMSSGSFSVLYLQGGCLVAANLVNNGREMPQARKLIANPVSLDVDRLTTAPQLDEAVLAANA